MEGVVRPAACKREYQEHLMSSAPMIQAGPTKPCKITKVILWAEPASFWAKSQKLI